MTRVVVLALVVVAGAASCHFEEPFAPCTLATDCNNGHCVRGFCATSCTSDADCLGKTRCIDSLCVDAGEGEGDVGEGEGEGNVGEGEGGEGEGEGGEGEGEGGEGEGEGGEGEGEGEGEGTGIVTCPPGFQSGSACDDGIDCTIDDRCQTNGVCVGVPQEGQDCATQCPVDCATTCAPCCTQQGAQCGGGCGTCVDTCFGDCEVDCSAGAACEMGASQTNHGNSTLHCTQATCRAELGVNPQDVVTCVDHSFCDLHIHDLDSSNVTCDASTCRLDLAGGNTQTIACVNGSLCAATSLDIDTSWTCTGSNCSGTFTDGSHVFHCTAGSSCDVTCDTATCDVECDGTSSCRIACGNGASCTIDGVTCNAGSVCND